VAVLDEHLVELEVAGLDIEALGFDRPQREDDVVEDEVPPVPDEPVTVLGDLWQVGPHRIICGDSTDPLVHARLMDGAQADMVFTDPPYGVDVQERDLKQAEIRGRRKDGKGVLNDNLDAASLEALLNASFGATVANCKKGAAWYVCGPQAELMLVFGHALAKYGLFRHGLVWFKDALVMGRSDYHYRHEVIFYGWVPGAAHNWYADRKQDSVWEFKRPTRSPEHPTMKPVELVAYAMGNSSKRGDKVLDPFCGSGTTLVAAAQTGRVGFGIELSPAYVDVIVKRLEDATGETAVRMDG
jgi:DNA modification methylase